MNSITRPELLQAETPIPTRRSGLVFAVKAAGLRLQRRWRDRAAPLPRLAHGDPRAYPALIAESVTPLWSDPRQSEARHQFGKVENLRRAAWHFDGLVLPADGVFSFWGQLGRPTRGRGFVPGRMLREGCLTAATGGGLCQISNALFAVALEADCAIVERHAHSRIVPGSAAALGRDATVAWNYVDLRFRAPRELMLRVSLSASSLIVQLRGRAAAMPARRNPSTLFRSATRIANDCGSCSAVTCHRHEGSLPRALGRSAFLLDEAWPEFRAYVRERKARGDLLAIPLDGRRWGKPRYAWETEGFAKVATASLASLAHSWAARHATGNGQRVAVQLRRSEAIARKLAKNLTPDMTEVCVAQSLLPFLWRMGVLGGRRVTVLMTRLPMAMLQARLDAFAAINPERATLADFRAPTTLVGAETEALAAADRIVTPHALIAAQFPGRAERLDWHLPASRPLPRKSQSRTIAFPGPTLARKGAHELRAAALGLDCEIALLGGDLEGAGFWHGLATRPAARDGAWLSEAAAVVQPALIEEQPRALLAALAAGVPVIASQACGIVARPGVTLVPEGDSAALRQALERLFQDIAHNRH